MLNFRALIFPRVLQWPAGSPPRRRRQAGSAARVSAALASGCGRGSERHRRGDHRIQRGGPGGALPPGRALRHQVTHRKHAFLHCQFPSKLVSEILRPSHEQLGLEKTADVIALILLLWHSRNLLNDCVACVPSVLHHKSINKVWRGYTTRPHAQSCSLRAEHPSAQSW